MQSTTSFEIGLAHHQRGQLEQAAQQYRATLAETPDHFVALNLLGVVALQRNDVASGIDLIQQAIAIKPDFSAAHLNLGNALRLLKRYENALSSYEQAIALEPDSADAISNRGVALSDLSRNEEALASYDRALALDSNHTQALVNHGNALTALGRHVEALVSHNRALQHSPDNPQVHNNRGVTLRHLLQPQESLFSFEQALTIDPCYLDALANRADILRALKRRKEALDAYIRLLALQPDYPYAIGNKLEAQLHICDWTNLESTIRQVIEATHLKHPAATPSFFLAASDSAESQLKCAQNYSARHYPTATKAIWAGERYNHERIRIAYLSADFHNHATAYLMAELFELHDKTRFEVVAISFGPDTQSDMRKRLECALGTLVDVRSLSDEAVASLLRQHEIDIAVDLKGFTQGSRIGIFAHRAVPLQVSYLGYPGTSGAPYLDYILADARVTPEGHEHFYSEKIVRLPNSYQVNDSKRTITKHTPIRRTCKLPESGFVFCSFNNNYKITPPVFDIWMRLLHQVDGSVLWLLQDNPSATENLMREAAMRGIGPQRLVFAPRVAPDEHLARHRLADLFLDTRPVNAHTTASDALWAGLPVLTCTGEAFASRVASSLLYGIGLPELVTHTLEDYETLALSLATTPALLSAVKSRLEHNRLTQPLFDTARFCRHIESAFITMHDRSQLGLAPAHFTVKPMP